MKEKINCPFENGDICYLKTETSELIFIFKNIVNDYVQDYTCLKLTDFGPTLNTNENVVLCHTEHIKKMRFATEEEEQILFAALEYVNYKWNPEAKTLQKYLEPKFKVNDVIQFKNRKVIITKIDTANECYIYKTGANKKTGKIQFEEQNAWSLAHNKFDINTLKPFESRVLGRDSKSSKWTPAIWGMYDENDNYEPYKCIGTDYPYCIPYEGNEHLLGTTKNCDEYFKTWEKAFRWYK